ncbi:GntR family transcriptional regulator [Cryptosporangium minutisporangium]|uniref:GntR family transcriptional regulator n=1 Tax=Cryptosporangium minutisporangium TaxID=113569 RepID=A0ABP6TA78_9ACTN
MENVAAPSDTGALETPSLVDLAVARLRADILSGGTEPGERLVEEQLTRRFGISRAPLREALRLLAQQGLVDHFPRRGARVATLTDADLQQLYGVRDLLERYAVEQAFPIDDPRRLVALHAELDAMRAADEVGDRFAMAEAHRRFHVALVALASNRQLAWVHESVLVKTQLYMAINLRREADTGHGTHNVLRHQRLYDAVAGRDPETVLSELAAHGARQYIS